MKVEFTIVGEPCGKGRPRFATVGGYVKTYTPKETVNYENLVKLSYRMKYGLERFGDTQPLLMCVKAYYSIPKSTSKKQRQLMLEKKIRPTKKPDWDNIGKIVADSLNGVAYRDDAQVVDAFVRKYYSDNPRVEVTITDDDD